MIDELYMAHCDELTAFATGLAHSRDAAEDLVQEAFLKALQNLTTLSSLKPEQRRAWLYTAVRNRFFDDVRKSTRETCANYEEESATDDLSVTMVSQALYTLKDDARELVIMRYFAGMNSSEIAAKKGLPAATVRTRLRAAAKKLKEYYEK